MILGDFELSRKEIKQLGLIGKIRVNWWGPDLVPLHGKNSFYYIQRKESKEVSDLIEAYPACLLIREQTAQQSKKSNLVRVLGLPKMIDFPEGDLSNIDFSHYYIGTKFIQSINWENISGEGSFFIEKSFEVVPIVFLKKK